MAHGDDKGLRLPPKIAPHQVVMVPIAKNENGHLKVREFISPVLDEMRKGGIRIYEDWSDNSPGFKFNEWEMKGVPLRLEVGPRDIESGQAVLVRRDTGQKIILEKNMITEQAPRLLEEIQKGLFEQALAFREKNTHEVSSYSNFRDTIKNKGGFIRCGWDGTQKTEMKIKEDTNATIRCILNNEDLSEMKCVYSGNPAKHVVIYGKAY